MLGNHKLISKKLKIWFGHVKINANYSHLTWIAYLITMQHNTDRAHQQRCQISPNVWLHQDTEVKSHLADFQKLFLRRHAFLLTNQSWIEHPWVNKNLHCYKSITSPWAQPGNWKSRDSVVTQSTTQRFQGWETDPAFYYIWVCSQTATSLLLTWMKIHTTILHSKLSRVIIAVTGNVELGPDSWLNFGWLGRKASSACKGCGFLSDHPGLGLQTLPITKPNECVWPLLEASRSVHRS